MEYRNDRFDLSKAKTKAEKYMRWLQKGVRKKERRLECV